MHVRFTVDGQPVGKGRPKFRRTGTFVQTYTPTKTKGYEAEVQAAFIRASRYIEPAKSPVHVEIRLYYAIPKSTSKTKRAMMEAGQILPVVKPDVDNVAKAILDALNGLAFDDDNKIVSLNVEKYYSAEPRAVVTIVA